MPTVESALVRDALGRVIEEKRSDGTLTRTTYDRTGGVLRQETGAGAVTLVVRDGRGLPIEEVRPAGRGSTKRAFDSSGALILESTSNASGTPWETRTTLDSSGRPVRVDYADGSFETLAYNTDSTVSHRRTRDGVEVDFTYDAANRLTSAVPTLPEGSPSATRIDAGDHTVYDALSRPTQIERGRSGIPGYDTELTLAIGGYDLASRPLAETVGTRSPLTWTYDAFDRKTRTTMGTLGTLERSYDTLDRLLTITGPASSGATWSWGGDRLYAMTAHGALGTTTRFGYAGGAGQQIPGQPGDDTTWRLATLTWGASGSSAATALPATTWGQFGYGWRGTATAPSDGAKLGRAAIPAAPNAPNLTAGLGWSWGYDAATRLTGAASGNGDLTGAALDNGSATLDKHRFTYGEGDELERLVRESTGAITAVESGPYGRITSRNGQAFAYDGAGRRLEDDRFVLRWDWRGQLVSATVKPTWPDSDGDGQAEVTPYAGHLVRYAYDAAGRLAHRLHLGALPAGQSDDSLRPFIDQRRYVWEGQSLLSESSYGLEGTEASLRWRKTYVPGPAGLDDAAQVVVDQSNQSRIYTYLRDELGTVQSLVDESQSSDPLHPSIAGRYFYSPYGEAHVESAPELLRAHINGDVASVNGTPQAISDPRVAAPGALLLDWSAALDASTLAAGVALETQVGGAWTPLTGAEVAIVLDNSATKLTILPTHGWAASTSYRLRLTPSLRDTLGRALVANETIELRTAAAPSTGGMPALAFDRKTARSYESWRAANDTLGNRFPGGQSHLFQGAWTDPVTGLAYHRARWYEPRTAHWLSEDPAGTVDSVNLQAFVGWGPNLARDPLGLSEQTVEMKEQEARLKGLTVDQLAAAATKREEEARREQEARAYLAAGLTDLRARCEYGCIDVPATPDEYQRGAEGWAAYRRDVAIKSAMYLAPVYVSDAIALIGPGLVNARSAPIMVEAIPDRSGPRPAHSPSDRLLGLSGSHSVDPAERGISRSEYATLRRETPNQAMRDAVNPPVVGPRLDPVYGYRVDRYEADHIVPMRQIVEMPGFSHLTYEAQVEVLNLSANAMGLGKPSNASKSAKSWADWRGHPELGPIPPALRARMLEEEARARSALQAAIDARVQRQ